MNVRLNTSTAARIAYNIGKAKQRGEKHPVAYVIWKLNADKDAACRIARMILSSVVKHKGVWYENDRQIDDILATDFKKKNRS